MSGDFWLNVFGMIVAAGVSYGAIKSDLKNLHEKIKDVKDTADEAHSRIDKMLMRRRSTDNEE